MAMIKERQRDKCGSVDKKGKNRNNSSSSTATTQNNNTLKNESLEDDVHIKEESFTVPDDLIDKVSNSSPTSVACSFADTKAFAMDMCPVDSFMNADPVFPPDPCDGMIPMGSTEGALVDGGRPLSSNVINKQPSTMDAQYMQQQSQVFVFSTQMANKSAESVIKGKFNSIIEFHCAQPETKKYLMRNPLRVNQFNRQNQTQWMNNIGPIKSKSTCAMNNPRLSGKGNFRNNPMMSADMMNHGCGGPPPPPQSAGMNMPPRLPMWNQQGNMNPNQLMSNSVLPPPLGNFNEDQFPPSPRTSLTGVQIPDENLTPSQRQRRVQKLAYLQTIKEKLMPDDQQPTSQLPMNPELPPSTHNPPISIDDISSVLAADNNGGGGGPLGDPNDVSMPKSTNAGPGATPITPTDWQNMPSFFDERGKRVPDVNNMNRCGPRSQGPPPPYHQTTRSASVPIAVPSPNPNSPGNATSNLSLPSPRTCSGMNSPASKQGPGPSPTTNQINTSIESPGQSHGRGVNISNPGTPVSSGMHLSPNSKQKDNKMCTGPMSNEFSPATSGQQSPDGIYSRSLQSLARQQQQKQLPSMPHTQGMPPNNSHCKEPPLMPVPSPQHIQYLSSFEGQELTIQKQPNTSLKDTSNISPSLSQAGLDTIIPVSTDGSCSKVTVSAPNTPLTPSSLELGSSKYPGTPGDFSALSPSADPKSQLRGINSNQLKNDLRFSCSSPQLPDQQRFAPANANFMPQGNKNAFMDASSPEKASCGLGPENKDPTSCAGGNYPRGMMPNNVPIDPSAAPKPSFDPISSLAQMSQQLTNNVPGSMCPSGGDGGGGPMQGNMLGQYPPMMGQMGQQMPNNLPGPMCPSGPDGGGPKPGNMPGQYPPMMGGNPPRMMRPPGPMPGSYNNANVQVKPNAPNTIQYLPNRPQSAGVGARGPPSLEFLRYQNSNAMPPNMEKMHPHNMNYFQGNYPGGPPPGANMNDMMGNMNCAIPPGNPMIRSGMRGPNPPPNMMRMGGGNMGMSAYNDQMYPPGGPNVNMPNSNCHMFMPNAGGPGPKMPPMSMGGSVAPDATQPLPPSMGQANNFKNQSFMGQLTPEMSDPQYRQQFHNFQQQLYATNTRSQMNNMPGSNQQYFVPK